MQMVIATPNAIKTPQRSGGRRILIIRRWTMSRADMNLPMTEYKAGKNEVNALIPPPQHRAATLNSLAQLHGIAGCRIAAFREITISRDYKEMRLRCLN